MADVNEVFRAVIAASDEASATIDKIDSKYKHLGHTAETVGHETGHLHNRHMWMELGEHIDLTKEKFGGLRGSIGEVGGSITELLPALGALGAIGSVVALFETTEHTAESFALLAHSAKELGTSANDLNKWRAVAKLTDTDQGSMEKSMQRLNRTMGDVARGKNKDAAALFAHMHINPKSFATATDMLPALASAFEKTHLASTRASMAFTLFGRSGMEMLPMLMMGPEKLKEVQKELGKYLIDFRPYAKGLDEYNESQKKLHLSVEGFTDLLGGKLAPVLGPLTDEASDFVVANREWITGEISGGVKKFSEWLKKLPYKEIEEDVRGAIKVSGEFVDAIGGPKVAIEGLAGVMALKTVLWLAEPIKETVGLTAAVGKLTYKLSTELVKAWTGVGEAATIAGGKELAAAEMQGGAGTAAVAARGAARLSAGDMYLQSIGEEQPVAGPATMGAGLDRLRAQVRAANAGGALRVDNATATSLRFRGVAAGLNIGDAALNALDGADLDKDQVRRMPNLAAMMTREQFTNLPEHIARPVPWLGITDDPANPGWIERHFENRRRQDDSGDSALHFAPSVQAIMDYGLQLAPDTKTSLADGLLPSAALAALFSKNIDFSTSSAPGSLKGLPFTLPPENAKLSGLRSLNFAPEGLPSRPSSTSSQAQNGKVDMTVRFVSPPAPIGNIETNLSGTNIGRISTDAGQAWADMYQ